MQCKLTHSIWGYRYVLFILEPAQFLPHPLEQFIDIRNSTAAFCHYLFLQIDYKCDQHSFPHSPEVARLEACLLGMQAAGS